MLRIPAFFTGLATIAAAATSAVAQCPTDFTLYFPDRPDAYSGGYIAGVMTALTRFDPDGTGPLAPIFIASFHHKDNNCFGINTERSRIDRWDPATQTWMPMTSVFDGMVWCMTTFDEDQGGPTQPRLYIGGRFSGFGPAGGSVISSPNIMRYDGTNFAAVRGGLNGEVSAMLVFDDDATGPIAPKLYMGGNFGAANSSAGQGQVNCGRLIRMTGSQIWENPGSGFDDQVFALCSYDEDGPGAGLPKLAVGGAFSGNNGDGNQRLVSIYNGATWSPLSQGLDRMVNLFGSGRRVFALAEFDEDGTGPNNPSLFVGGSIYQTTQGLASPLVIRWKRNHFTGTSGWIAVGAASGLQSQSSSDACANFCSNTPLEGNRPRVTCMMPFDVDGAGPLASELYIGGDMYGDVAQGLMKWSAATESQWVIGASGRDFHEAPAIDSVGVAFPSMALTMTTVPGNASVPPVLLIGGGFMDLWTCGGGVFYWNSTYRPTFYATAWSSGGSGPSVNNPPDNTWVTFPGASTAFSLSLTGTGPFTYQWRKDGVNLVNGASQGFGGVLGATGPGMIIGGTASPVNTTSQGWYDCRVSNACGDGVSTRAWLVVQPNAAPYFPIRFDAAVAPVTTPIGNAPMTSIFGTGTPWPRFYSLVGGTPFAIAPTGNNAWRSRLASGSATGIRSVTIPTSQFGVGEVYTMLNTDGSSNTNVRFTFSATGGLSYTTTLSGGTHLRSFSNFFGPQATTSVDTSTVFDSGLTRLDKQRILLPDSFRGQTLTSITISDLGTDSTGRAILAGLTLRQRPPACGPSDIAGAEQVIGADGFLTADDIIVFLGWFFAGDFRADVAGANQSTTPDGVLTADDIIVFLGRYFAGC